MKKRTWTLSFDARDVTVKLTAPHSRKCPFVGKKNADLWAKPWSFAGAVRRDALGRRNRGQGFPWLLYRCNCCQARLLVYAASVGNGLPPLLGYK